MKNTIKRIVIFIFLLTSFFIWSKPIFSEEPAAIKGGVDCSKLQDDIKGLEKKFKRPCDEVQVLMEDLIKLWTKYYDLERERINNYEDSRTLQWKQFLNDFITKADEGAKVEPGVFYNMFMKLKEEARESELLIEGTPPWKDKKRETTIGNAEFAFHSDAEKYFYFAETETEGKECKEIIKDFQDRLKDLKERWDENRNRYYKFFSKDYFNEVNGKIKSLADEMATVSNQYEEKAKSLSKVAYSGEFEHCLGKIESARPSYSIVGDQIVPKLFEKGQANTVEALPGMGLKFLPPTEIPPLAQVEVPNCPFTLEFKRDGVKAQEYIEAILEIQLETEKIKTIELGNEWASSAASFAFDSSYYAVESLAPLGNFLIGVVYPPLKSLSDAKNAVVKFATEVDILTVDKKIVAALEKTVKEGIEKVQNMATEKALDTYDPSRFEVKPDDPPWKRLEKLSAHVESARKINEGVKVCEKVTGEVAAALTGGSQIKFVGKGLSLAEKTVAGLALKQKKGEILLKQLKDLKTKYPSKVKIDLDAEEKALAKLADKQQALDQKMKEFVSAKKEGLASELTDDLGADFKQKAVNKAEPWSFKGEKIPSRGEIKAVDAATGKEMTLQKGEMLGEGATSKFYVNAEKDSLGIRETSITGKTRSADIRDEFGRKVLEKEVQSDAVRVAKREGVFENKEMVEDWNTFPPGQVEKVTKYEVVERVEHSAEQLMKKQGGKLSEGQKLAFEQAHRDLNAKGYVWLDDHPGNFTLEKLPGEDRWRVVVFDPGGIYMAKGSTLAEKAANAASLRKAADETFYLPWDGQTVRGAYLKDNGHLIDYESMGLKIEDVAFACGSKRPNLDLGDIARLTDNELTGKLAKKADEAMAKISHDAAEGVEGAIKPKLLTEDELRKITREELQPNPRSWKEPENLQLDEGSVGDKLGEGTFSQAFMNSKNPHEVIKAPVDLNDPGKFEMMIERQIEGAKHLDEAGIDYPKITGKGEITTVDGQKLPVFSQELVSRDSIMEKIVKDRTSRGETPLSQGMQEAIAEAVYRANKKGIVIGDLKWDNIYLTKTGEPDFYKVGILDMDYIGHPKASSLENMSLSDLQLAQITGKFKVQGAQFNNPEFAKDLIINAMDGGSAGSMGEYLSDDLLEILRDFKKADDFFAKKMGDKLEAALAQKPEYQALKYNELKKSIDEVKDEMSKKVDTISKAYDDVAKNEQYLKELKEGKTPLTEEQSRLSEQMKKYASESEKSFAEAGKKGKASVSEDAAAAGMILTNYALRMTLMDECLAYKKLLLSGASTQKLERMGNPCARLGEMEKKGGENVQPIQ